MTTQPAGEHHTGTLDLAACLGNPRSCSKLRAHNRHVWTDGEIDYDCGGNEAEVVSPISDDAVGAFSEAYLLEILSRVSTASLPSNSAVRAGLTAAYPAIRQQIAEEIAVTIERSEDDARRAEKQTRDPGWSDIATGYMRSAELAREIGAGTPRARTGTPVTNDLPPTPQARSKRLPGAKA